MAHAHVVKIRKSETIEVSKDLEKAAEHGHYMISAAPDIMESTFGDRELHERTTGKKNTLYCSPRAIGSDHVSALRSSN